MRTIGFGVKQVKKEINHEVEPFFISILVDQMGNYVDIEAKKFRNC